MKRIAIIFLVLFCMGQASGFVMNSRLDPRMDPEDSPTFVDLILSGGNIMSAGSLKFKPSGDNNDYLELFTPSGTPIIKRIGGNDIQFHADGGSPIVFFYSSGVPKLSFGWNDGSTQGELESVGGWLFSTLNNSDITLTPDGTGITTVNSDITITGVATVNGLGTGGQTDYDLKVGDTDGTPTYGMIQIGNACIGRTSFKAGSIDLDGTIIYRNIAGPVTSEIEHVFVESTGDSTRFALAKAGVGNATYNSRSMLIAGPAPADTDYVKVSYWQTNNNIFHNLVCDTSGAGADVGVQNDLEVEGDIFTDSIKESTPGAGIGFNFFPIINAGDIDNSIDPTAITDLSPTLFWTLNGVLTATTGGADLVEQSGPTAPDYCDRGTFKAWQGDGTLYFKASGVEGPLGSDARTTLSWVKTNATILTNQRILEYGTGTGRWDFLFTGVTEALVVVGGGGNIATSNTDPRIVDGEWHLLAVTLVSGGGWSDVKFYIDGDDIGLASSIGGTVNTLTNTDIWVGARSTGATPLEECMGLVAVFNTDLTQANIQNIFDRQRTRISEGADPSSRDVSNMSDPINTTDTISAGKNITGLSDLIILGAAKLGAPGVTHKVVGGISFGGPSPLTNTIRMSESGVLSFHGTGGIPHGNMYGFEITETVTITSANQWEEVTGSMTGGHTLSTTFQNNHEIEVTNEGKYGIAWSLSCQTTAAQQELMGSVTINSADAGVAKNSESACAKSAANHQTTVVANKSIGLAGSTICDLSAGDVISFIVMNETGTQNITIEHATFRIDMLGGT